MDLTPYVENVRRYTAELKRRNAEAAATVNESLRRFLDEVEKIAEKAQEDPS